jgi:hypothetical protein
MKPQATIFFFGCCCAPLQTILLRGHELGTCPVVAAVTNSTQELSFRVHLRETSRRSACAASNADPGAASRRSAPPELARPRQFDQVPFSCQRQKVGPVPPSKTLVNVWKLGRMSSAVPGTTGKCVQGPSHPQQLVLGDAAVANSQLGRTMGGNPSEKRWESPMRAKPAGEFCNLRRETCRRGLATRMPVSTSKNGR